MPTPPRITTIGKPDELLVSCSTWGASLTSLKLPVGDQLHEMILGYSTSRDHLNDQFYVGGTCGRYANRIANASFTIDGTPHQIDTDQPCGHALHGGTNGFHKRPWEKIPNGRPNSISYSLVSVDGDQGFPGELKVTTTYTIINKTHLLIDFIAATDQATILNLVNHTYFNLNNYQDTLRPIDNHCVSIFADQITQLDHEHIPTGEISDITGTPFDLRHRKTSQSIQHDDEVGILNDRVFDQNYILTKAPDQLSLAATVHVPNMLVALAVYTTQPGLQFYTGDYLSGTFGQRAGLCLESQEFPDAPNHPHFPDSILRPDQVFRSQTIYAFGKLEEITEHYADGNRFVVD